MTPQNPQQSNPGQQSGGQQPSRPGQQSGGQPQQQPGARPGQDPSKSLPRYDDRPERSSPDREAVQREENEGSAGSTTKTPEQRVREATKDDPSRRRTDTGTPHYGDQEPGDPRRSDVEGDESKSS